MEIQRVSDVNGALVPQRWPLEAARQSLQRADVSTALDQLQAVLVEANEDGDIALQERAAAALALCRSLMAMDRVARELDEAHRRSLELQASEREIVSSALDDVLAGASSRLPPAPSRLGPGLMLGGFALPFSLGVVELTRPASLNAGPSGQCLRLRLLGRFEVELDGCVMAPWRSGRARQLLAYLALNRRGDLSRHRLMGVFWPEHSEERAENNLSLTVLALRRLLDVESAPAKSLVRFQPPSYGIEATEFWLDTEAFEEALSRAAVYEACHDADLAAQALDEALALYGGDLLPGDAYEDWTAELRQRFQDLHTDALQRRSILARKTGDYDLSIELNRRLLRRDPACEPAHRQLMLDYLATGQRSRAAAQMALCTEALRHHLGVAPDETTQAVYRRIAAT